MKKILLIINDDKVRQVYHKTLLSKDIEVVPVINLSTAIMFLSLEKFTLAILEVGPNPIETEVFLKLRQKHRYLSKTKLIILSQSDEFNPQITKNDLIIHTSKIPTKDIINQIENQSNL